MISGFILGGVLFVLIATALAVYFMYISSGDDEESELHEETRESLEEDEIAAASEMDDEEGRFQN